MVSLDLLSSTFTRGLYKEVDAPITPLNCRNVQPTTRPCFIGGFLLSSRHKGMSFVGQKRKFSFLMHRRAGVYTCLPTLYSA